MIFNHLMNKAMKALIKIFAVVLTLSLLAACSQEFAPNPGSLLNTDDPSFAMKKDDGGDAGVAGNNLSLPVIWADGSLSLRYDMTEPADLKGVFYELAGENWYVQDDPQNEWQAFNGVGEDFEIFGPIDITYVDWGDNLEVKAWPATGIVRVETRLYKALNVPQNAYTMMHISGLGVDEIWGTNGKVYGAEEATIYSDEAVLVIQRITKDEPSGNEPGDLRWDMQDRKWVGDDVLETRVWEEILGEEGPGGYGAEVNVQGVVVYGYNWNMKQDKEKYEPGVYRITFSLGNAHAMFTGDSYIMAAEEEEPEASIEAEDDEGGANIPGYAEIRPGLNLTYIDVMIEAKSTGGGGGGGNGGGGHTGGSNTSHGNSGNGGSGGHGNN
jgi:uncharacterized membrane protein YgcG